jgi:hypothetical protein
MNSNWGSFPTRTSVSTANSHSTGYSTLIIIITTTIIINIRDWYNRPNSGRRARWTQSHPIPRQGKKNKINLVTSFREILSQPGPPRNPDWKKKSEVLATSPHVFLYSCQRSTGKLFLHQSRVMKTGNYRSHWYAWQPFLASRLLWSVNCCHLSTPTELWWYWCTFKNQ